MYMPIKNCHIIFLLSKLHLLLRRHYKLKRQKIDKISIIIYFTIHMLKYLCCLCFF